MRHGRQIANSIAALISAMFWFSGSARADQVKVSYPNYGVQLRDDHLYKVHLKCSFLPEKKKFFTSSVKWIRSKLADGNLIGQHVVFSLDRDSTPYVELPPESIRNQAQFAAVLDANGVFKYYDVNHKEIGAGKDACNEDFIVVGHDKYFQMQYLFADTTRVNEYLEDLSMFAKPAGKLAGYLPPTPWTKPIKIGADVVSAAESFPQYLVRFGFGYRVMTKPEKQPITLLDASAPIRITTPLAEVEVQTRRIRSFDRSLSNNDLKTLRGAIVAALNARAYDQYMDSMSICRDFKTEFLNSLIGQLTRDDQAFLLGYFSEIIFASDTNQRLECIGDAELAYTFTRTNYNQFRSVYKVTFADVTQHFSLASR